MVQGHRYFATMAREWLAAGGAEKVSQRATAIETALRDLLQLVVIDLGADENAQEIFETLNARGAQLTAADLIKTFVFQRLLESGADVEAAYVQYWRDFESAFWEAELSVGRTRYSRSSIFLNHWLIARTGEEIVAREVFTRFKRYVDESGEPMDSLLSKLKASADVYRDFVQRGSNVTGPVDRLGLFAYRTSVMESEIIKPVILVLLDPRLPDVPDEQLHKSLNVIESWMVRRMLLRASTKSYSQIVAELIRHLRGVDRATIGEHIEQFFVEQDSNSRYWPDDNEVIEQLKVLPAYRRLGRGRLRMVLEAIEDCQRGWRDGQAVLGGERVARGKLAKLITEIWPTPPGYKSGFTTETVRPRHRVDLGDLVSSEFLAHGTELIPRRRKYRDQRAIVLPDGRIEYDGKFFSSPTEAAKAITKATSINGWWFFLVDIPSKRSLRDVRIAYLEAISADADEEDDED